jgi:hypothetical protein
METYLGHFQHNLNIKLKTILHVTNTLSGPGSSVGIVTDYGLDGPKSKPGGNKIFRPSRPAQDPFPSSAESPRKE